MIYPPIPHFPKWFKKWLKCLWRLFKFMVISLLFVLMCLLMGLFVFVVFYILFKGVGFGVPASRGMAAILGLEAMVATGMFIWVGK